MAIGIRGMASGMLLSTLTLASAVAMSATLSPAASAQEAESIPDALEDITTRRSGNYYRNSGKFRQLNFITGLRWLCRPASEQRRRRHLRSLPRADDPANPEHAHCTSTRLAQSLHHLCTASARLAVQ